MLYMINMDHIWRMVLLIIIVLVALTLGICTEIQKTDPSIDKTEHDWKIALRWMCWGLFAISGVTLGISAYYGYRSR